MEAIALPPGGGKTLQVLGNPWIIKAATDQTGGTIAALEGSFQPGSGAPAHLHHSHEETFYVLSGEFLFRLDSQSQVVSAGTFVFVPRGIPHGFENVGTSPGTILGIMTPAGFERFFEELAQLPPGPPDPTKLHDILAKHDQEIVDLPVSPARTQIVPDPLLSAASDVLIVGAGPVGLALAGDLRRRGVACRLIDSAEHATRQTKAVGIQARTLEMIARLGVAQTAIERGLRASRFSVYSSGKRLISINFQEYLQGTPYPYVLLFPQYDTEQILTEYLHGLGTSIEWQTELIALTQDEQGVEAVLRHPGEQDERVRVGWLVGCDGAHSLVRHLLGLQFVGSTMEQSFASFAVGNVRLSWDLSYEEVFAFLHQGNFIGYFPMANGRHRVVIAYDPDKAPTGDVTLQEIQEAIETCGPAGARASEPADLTRFHVNQRRTEHYRRQRIFLAGDAAHIHSPIGAQGMNTGIQDAFNLGWKLALTVSGHARAGLLDSYETEREQVGEALLRATDLTTHLALLRNPVLLAIRDALTPVLFASLPLASRRLAQSLGETNVAYSESPIGVDVREHKPSPRAGERAPDGTVHTADGATSLFDIFNSQRSIVLTFADDQPAHAAALASHWQTLQSLVSDEYGDVVEAFLVARQAISGSTQGHVLHDPTGEVHQRYAAREGDDVLIRPDGYIGFRGSLGATGALRSYLMSLFVPTK
jgi:2-polyprenyl-6-methoxyphenol hydroxylase-like FAD-dependent oxidoreductase/quercetin dioxygenase-like cupin family protein